MQGIFPVLQTPLTSSGDLDTDSLKRQVSFCIQAGAHGLVFPVLGSEFQYLSDRERQRLVPVVVAEAAGRIPVVAGVAGPSMAIAVEHARHAAEAGADAVIALPPYLASPSQEESLAYYQAISGAANRPIFIQHSGLAPMSPAFLVRLLKEVEHVHYIKEERNPSAHNISQVVQTVGDACRGVFGGAHGKWMLSEMKRGAVGFMPAAQTTDVYVQIWDAFQAGDEAKARQIFNRHLPLINFITLLGLRVCKEVLVRRGVIQTTGMRAPGAMDLDAEDHTELDAILEDLQDLFTVY